MTSEIATICTSSSSINCSNSVSGAIHEMDVESSGAADFVAATTNMMQDSTVIDSDVACDGATAAGSGMMNENLSRNSQSKENFLVRMYVNPFHAIPKQRVTPVKYQTRIPLPLHQMVVTSSILTMSNFNESQERRDEWKSIWQQVNDFMSQEPTLKDMKRDKDANFRLVLPLCVLLFSVPFIDDEQLLATVMYIIGGGLLFGIITFAIHTCIKYGEPNQISFMSTIRTSYMLKLLSLIGTVWIVIYLVIDIEENYWAWYDVFILVPLFVVLLFLLYIAGIMLKPLVISCRNRCFVNLDLHDKALVTVHYEIKKINTNLVYFSLHPKLGFDNFNLAVDVYDKEASDNSIGSTDGLESQPVLSSSSNILMGVATKRRGFGTGVEGNDYINELQQYQGKMPNPNVADIVDGDLRTPLLAINETTM